MFRMETLLLNSDRRKTLNAAEIQQLDQEDKLLKQLRDIRNQLAHNASKSYTSAEFNQRWTDLATILVAFGDIDTELDKLKDDSVFEAPIQQINEDNVKEASRLNSLGTQAHKDGRFTEAITSFTKATVLSGVADHDRAIFFSNMSSSRLARYEQQAGPIRRFEIDDPMDLRYRALQDAKQARNLWSTWWKGHLRVGKVYAALNEHEKAINSFERAKALDPVNNEIQKVLDESRETHSRQLRQEHLDPSLRPMSMHERLHEIQQKLGKDPEHVRITQRLYEEIDPSAADSMKGHQFEHGDIDVKQNYEEAAKYFAKAASQGNAEGMYNLARLTHRGLGVKKDQNIAQKLLEQAVAQPVQHPKLKSVRNPGVAEAEHALGLRYTDGIAVHKSLATAAYWYQRAMEHGYAPSGNNLALMYYDGVGVDQNLDKAEQLLEAAAKSGVSDAMERLAKILLDKNELQMAKIWYDRACEAGNIFTQTNRHAFEELLQRKQKLIDGSSLNGMQRMNKITNVYNSLKISKTTYTLSDRSYISDYDMLIEHANRGSITARKMCDALNHFVEALSIVIRTDTLTENEENVFVHELSQCYRIQHIVAQILDVQIREKILKVVDRVLSRCDTESSTAVSQLDEDIRICYAALHADAPELIVKFLSLCKQKYPKSIHFFEFSAAMNGFLKRYEAALYDANLGSEIDSKYSELLYDKAGALCSIEMDMDEIIEAYRAFLAVAPKDHRKVPGSYYTMAHCYFLSKKNQDITDNVKKIYQQGEEAEKLQLPCFLPYQSNSKTIVKLILDENVLPNAASPAPIINNKSRLTNPYRIEAVLEHRKWQSRFLQKRDNPVHFVMPITCKPRVQQRTAKSLIGLKPITLREMNPIKDHVYDGYVLSVTIIEEAYSWTPSVHLVIEDEHLDCQKLCVYSFPEDYGEYLTSKVYRIGSKMNIINPYLRLAMHDNKLFIRVDDFSSIMMQSESERIINMCRCCGEANALKLRGKCKQARYCTRECQTIDWQIYKHKLICKNQ
jgi:TPR repeat protein